MIGIVFSTKEEAQAFLDKYQRGRFDGLGEGETTHDDDVLVSILGSGKIKGALRTERLLRSRKLDTLIHAGTCTALAEEFEKEMLVAASQVFEGDRIELSSPTYPRMPLSVPFEDLPTGTLVTQDHTVSGSDELSYWQRIADMSDMTGYAVAYVAATHGTACHVVKVVTGHMGVEDKNLRRTLETCHKVLADFLTDAIPALKEKDD